MSDSNETANPAGFIWYQDGYEIKEMFIDGTLNIIMRKAKIQVFELVYKDGTKEYAQIIKVEK